MKHKLVIPARQGYVLTGSLLAVPQVLSGWRPPGGMSGSAAAQQASALCRLVLEVYAYLLAHLTPDQQPHYTFTPRDLTHWVQGLARWDYGRVGSTPQQDDATHVPTCVA